MVMSLKYECHSNWNVTQIGMSLKLEYHSNWMSLKLESFLNYNITQIGMSLKLEYHKIYIGPQIGTSPILECHSNRNVT